jgi:hypothetical protein
MISFSCGTYHGLFVETGAPSVLPKDISYFDFRTKGGRVVPADDTPNLIVRYSSSRELGEPPMMMVALNYRAIEGSREGFIAFGCLLFEPFSAKKIEDGIQTAIKVAQNSTNIFDGKNISGRPTSQEGKPLDLRNLPLLEGEKFFGELQANVDSGDAIKYVANFAQNIVSSGIDHYEIVVNPHHGMNQNDLLEHFNYLDSREKQKVQSIREKLSRAEDRKRQEKAFDAQRRIHQSKRNAFLLQTFAFVIVGVALVSLLAFVTTKFIFTADQVEGTQPLQTEIGPFDSEVYPESGLENNIVPTNTLEEIGTTDCELETLSKEDKTKHMIITDLETDGKCIRISDSVTSKFASISLDRIITSKNVNFSAADKLPELNEVLLTTFGRVFDDASSENFDSKYVDESKNFAIPDENLSIALSMETVIPKLFCSLAASEKNSQIDDFPKFEFYTKAQNDYRDVVGWFSKGVLLHMARTYQEIGDGIKVGDPNDDEATSVGNRLLTHGDRLDDLVNSDGLSFFTGQLYGDEKVCVILFTREDELAFYKKLELLGISFKHYDMGDFLIFHANMAKKFREQVKSKSQIECQKIPNLFMVWKSEDGAAMILEGAKGFHPYTMEGKKKLAPYNVNRDQLFYYDLQSSDEFYPPIFKLPALEGFKKLKSHFDADSDFTPFSQDFYEQKDFCFAATPDNQ